MIRLDKEKVVEKLIDDTIDTFENGFREGLVEILKEGFTGYKYYPDEKLEQLYYEKFNEEVEIT